MRTNLIQVARGIENKLEKEPELLNRRSKSLDKTIKGIIGKVFPKITLSDVAIIDSLAREITAFIKRNFCK